LTKTFEATETTVAAAVANTWTFLAFSNEYLGTDNTFTVYKDGALLEAVTLAGIYIEDKVAYRNGWLGIRA
jgi:hypothetical protein